MAPSRGMRDRLVTCRGDIKVTDLEDSSRQLLRLGEQTNGSSPDRHHRIRNRGVCRSFGGRMGGKTTRLVDYLRVRQSLTIRAEVRRLGRLWLAVLAIQAPRESLR